MEDKTPRKKQIIDDDNLDPRSFSALSLRFLEWMRIRNYSAFTVEAYRTYLDYFIVFCNERAILRPSEVTKPILESYQRHLFYYRKANGLPLSFRSQHARIVPIKSFFKWLARQNFLLVNPAAEVEPPRTEHRLPKAVLTATEAEKVINQPNIKEPLGLRDRAILEVFYSTGIRRRELLSLCLVDLDFERGTVMVRQGKGRKDRLIPIGERAALWTLRYLNEVRSAFVVEPDEGFLFLMNTGEAFTPDRLSRLVADYVTSAQIGKTGACHLFRHTMATLMLENGADIRFIQQMLGHAEISSTQIYTQVSIGQLKEIHSATHPAKMQRVKAAGKIDEDNDVIEELKELSEAAKSIDVLFSTLAAEADDELGSM